MSTETNPQGLGSVDQPSVGTLPSGDDLQKYIKRRRLIGRIWQGILFSCTVIGLVVLAALLYTVVDEAVGVVAVQSEVTAAELSDQPLDTLSQEELAAILTERSEASGLLRGLNNQEPFTERSAEDLLAVINENVIVQEIVESWSMSEGFLNRAAIEAQVAEEYPRAQVEWHSWLSWDFLTQPMNATPALAGVRTALFGTLWVIAITVFVSIPLGVGAAIYLEEYATDTRNPTLRRINAIIQTNINNLAGVPSIIYGMLGLAIFVRALEIITSGTVFGSTDDPATANGRTVISAGLTLALLILPIIIINAQEAIRAVPSSLRQASYGLGATKWQTIWNVVLPNSVSGIMTGNILAMSRAVGETAPLIVVGASTFILTDPDGPFSKFTVLPILIYNWTARPSDQFRDIAAAAILVLLVVLLSMNALAVFIRNRYQRSL